MAVVGHPANPSLAALQTLGFGNVVEVLDTLAPLAPGHNFIRDWGYCHGGIANAPAYQLGISAFGLQPGRLARQSFYPWVGFRLGVIGEVKESGTPSGLSSNIAESSRKVKA